MTHFAVPTVNVLIVNDCKILLSRRANTGWMNGRLCIPGGHVEAGETPVIAAIREVSEELGVKLSPEELEFLCVAVRKQEPEEHLGFEFIVKDSKHEFSNNEPEKCSELIWVDVYNLPEDIIEDYRIVIENGLLGGEKYIEVGY